MGVDDHHCGEASPSGNVRDGQHLADLHRAYITNSPMAIVVSDAAGKLVEVNPAACRATGYAEAELLQMSFLQLLAEESQEAGRAHLQAVKEHGQARRELCWVPKDGSRRWGLCNVVKLSDDRFVAFCTDTTDRKALEESLRQAAERQRAILDAIPDPAWLKDEQGRFLAVNAAWSRHMGVAAADALGKTVRDLFSPEPARQLDEQDRGVLQSRETLCLEELLPDAEGRGVWFETTKCPIQNERGEVAGTAGLARDITKRKRAEEALRREQSFSQAIIKGVAEGLCVCHAVAEFPFVAFTVWNARMTEITGYALEEINRRGWYQSLYPDPRVQEQARLRMAQMREGDDILGEEWEITRSDGQTRVVSISTSLLVADDGTRHALALMQDVTDRKRAEEALRVSEQFQRDTINALNQHIAVLDRDGAILAVNAAWQRFAEENGADLASRVGVGANYLEVCRGAQGESSHEAAAAAEGIQAVLQGKVPSFRLEYPCHAPHAQRWFLMQVTPLSFTRGGAIVTHLDITDRLLAEQEKLELERRLLHARKLESLSVLAGGIAHDFNNILAGILGYVELLKLQPWPSPSAGEDLDVIRQAVRRAAGLTRQMLAYAGKGRFLIEPVHLSHLVQDMQKLLAVSVSKKTTLTYHLAVDPPPIRGDASQIHQVVSNLVINASEALAEHPGQVSVAVDSVYLTARECAALRVDTPLREGWYVRLRVSDTGCGMSPETMCRIFDPFFTTKFTGRGLGLAAVQGIVHGHEGAIRVLSSPGEGTTFEVCFPAGEPAPRVEPAASADGSWHGGGTVLVVDDEEVVRNVAQRILEHAGFSVRTAANGEEAVQVFQERHREIVCVLLDMTMPRMDGAETIAALRRIAPQAVVILSSGYSEESYGGRVAGLGPAGFLQKPYTFDGLIAAVRKSVER